MRIFLTGASGKLGSALQAALTARRHEVIATDVDRIDVTDFAATRDAIAEAQPELVIHPAAWTDVDGCARDPQRAVLVNGFGAQHVALAAAAVGAAVAYISTNEVFDGRASRPYLEYDRPNPPNAYGYSKWVGEQATITLNPRHYIVRTAWLFAHGGANFLHSVLNAAREGRQLRVVANEVANPTYTNDLAEAIAALVETERYGIYHLVNEGACSRYELARYALERAGLGDTPVQKISSHQWSRPSTPPPYSALANMAGALVGIRLRPWQEAVDTFLAREQPAEQSR